MLDIKWIRDNPQKLDEALHKRGVEEQSQKILDLDKKRREYILKTQNIQEDQNKIAKKIGNAVKSGDKELVENLKSQGNALKESFAKIDEVKNSYNAELEKILMQLPNIPCEDVVLGKDEQNNLEVRKNGNLKNFPFPAKEHFELGESLKLMDFEKAGQISGARFTILKGDLAKLERAIGQFMIDLHTMEHGYTELSVPLLVRDAAVLGTAQLPKFSEDLFQTKDNRWLIPTAEVPLTNYVREQILEHDQLPLRLTALSPCFRSEAGSAGRDTRGMLRQHQFWKVELVSITDEKQSLDELERMTNCAEEVLKKLELPFRTMMLCTGDMGFSAKKTYDIEVWLPGQKAYREISSCSVCGDFQARRMNARYRNLEKQNCFVHTLNGSGTAVGRCLIAILENYQDEDESIFIPEVLQPYMNGLTKIQKK